MPEVESWVIFYADGSVFTSDMGTWAEAPPVGLFAVVYYDVNGVKHVQMEQHDNSVYKYLPYVDGAVEAECVCVGDMSIKFGLWVSNEQYFKLFDLVHGEVLPVNEKGTT